jgi:hypothetical protein
LSRDKQSIKGRLVSVDDDGEYVGSVRRYTLRATRLPGHVTLSGLSLTLTSSNGAGGYYVNPGGGVSYGLVWNTRYDRFHNIYVFTNFHGKPFFLNAGNSDISLNPNLRLAPGTHTIHFSAAPTMSTGHFGALRLYFDNNPAQTITTFAAANDSPRFAAVPAGAATYDQFGGAASGSGSLFLSLNNLRVELIDFRVGTVGPALVEAGKARPDTEADTSGSFTLRVTQGDSNSP